jgi:plastocyanin
MGLSRAKLLVTVAAIALAATGCGDKASEDTTGGAPADAAGGGTATTTVTISAINLAYDPREVEVEPGADFQIVFQNKDETPHTLTSDALGVQIKTDPGETAAAVTATAPMSGSAEFHCEIHSSMTGTISVAGSGAGSGGGGSGGGGSDGGGSQMEDSDSGYGY